MKNEHWSRTFLKQEIISVLQVGANLGDPHPPFGHLLPEGRRENEGEGLKQHHLELVELADHSKWVCKTFYPQTWLGRINESNLEFTETVAAQVATKLGVTFAAHRENNRAVLTRGKAKAIIVPYCEGQVLSVITAQQAYLLGCILAQMHLLKLPTTGAKPFPVLSLSDKFYLPSWLKELIANCNFYSHHQASEWVVSHRDIHAANIVWRNDGKPHLLDWESAGFIHPAIELIGLAANCAGFAYCGFEAKSFRATLMGYGEFAQKLPKINTKLWVLIFYTWLLWYCFCLRQNWLAEASLILQTIELIKEKAAEMQEIYEDCCSFFR